MTDPKLEQAFKDTEKEEKTRSREYAVTDERLTKRFKQFCSGLVGKSPQEKQDMLKQITVDLKGYTAAAIYMKDQAEVMTKVVESGKFTDSVFTDLLPTIYVAMALQELSAANVRLEGEK